MFAGGEVIFWSVNEGNPEVEHQVDDQRTSILCQKDLMKKVGQEMSLLNRELILNFSN